MFRITTACALALASSAVAAPVFTTSDQLTPNSGDRIEARFRADTTNWDTRLEFDSFPNNGDTTGNVANSRSNLEGGTFAFDLSFDSTTAAVSFTITRPDTTTSVLTQAVSGFDQLNSIQLFTSGSRGSVTMTALDFTGLGMDTNAFPNIDSQPNALGGPQFAETWLHFGNTFDLLSGDWSLTGNVHFDDFTRNNPSEGAKMTVKLRDTTIPAPASLALLGTAGLAATRRRRA